MEQAKFAYSLLRKALEKQIKKKKRIEDAAKNKQKQLKMEPENNT